MSEEVAARLALSDRGTLVAPAGHGKTWTLARAVRFAGPRQLVLTHTHAGVQSLRKHLAAAGVASEDVEVDTIDGYAMKWVTHYPGVAGWQPNESDPDWSALHPAALRVLMEPSVLQIVERSYRGLFVDEYQDCSVDQHELVRQLATALPTRLVGEPLQGIYNFPGSPAVDFKTAVWPEFPAVGGLDVPWRWHQSPVLGEDLRRLRQELLRGDAPNLASYEAIWVRGPHPAALSSVCRELVDGGGTVAVLRANANQAHSTASRLGGRYVSMEEVEGRDIVQAAQALETTEGPSRVAVLLDVLERCTTKVVPDLKTARRSFEEGEAARVPRGRLGPLVTALNAVADTESLVRIPRAIDLICSHHGTVVYRPEVPQTLKDALYIHEQADPSIALASAVRRARRQQRGRQLPSRIVSRTRLVKGLQFDHVVVCDSNDLDANNLYVALTRGVSSVTVVRT